MGRVKTTQIKRTAQKLVKENKDTFKPDFTKNKKLVNELVEVNSKKLRNVIAGYITRLVKNKDK
jgi:small subunit ribosomal protein S17e